MNNQEILIEEFKSLRGEINSRLKILHLLVVLASIFWLVLIVAGVFLEQFASQNIFYNFMILMPLIFIGLTFNYQDNQRTLETTARYLEDDLKPKLQRIYGDDILAWERWFASQKKKYQFSSSYKTFPLLIPFLIPIILLIFANLNQFQTIFTLIDIFFLIVIIINFRYKLYRIK